MFYEPNVDAVRFFVRQILPRIRKQSPRARFVVVGRDPLPDIAALHDGDTITVTGTVDDVAPYLRRASVAVVPIRFGSGTRIKILEAFAHGTPVVSTTLGAEGLEVANERELLLADAPDAFAAACVRLAADGCLQASLAERGLDLVRRRYQWQDVERQVQALIAGGRDPDWAASVSDANAQRDAEGR
jgi:glycosyltransferase involved in cell wall biosynthesis